METDRTTRAGTVLLVDDDPRERDRFGAWLEDAGYSVLVCPGPTGPDYVCVGGRGMRCPLADPADVVVLDMRLGGDIAMMGTPAWHVLVTYIAMGKHVIALVAEADPVHPRPDDQVTLIARPPTREELLGAVHGAGTRGEAAV